MKKIQIFSHKVGSKFVSDPPPLARKAVNTYTAAPSHRARTGKHVEL